MQKTLAELAKLINGEVVGDENLVITGLSGIKEAKEGDLTFLANPKYLLQVLKTNASAVLVSPGVEIPGKSVVAVVNPSMAFSKIISAVMAQESQHFTGIHPQAVIASDAKIGKNVAIGAFVVIESKASVGDNSIIYPHTYIGREVKIGCDNLIYPHVTIRERNSIGDRVIIHSGTVIGSDGFGYQQVDGVHYKIPQMGTVLIEDDVEIGANVTIDRARFDKTIIGKGTKIDNLVQIAHNVVTGENCIIVAQTGISGSTRLGKNVVLAGQAGLAGHMTVGDGAIVAAQAGVARNVPAGVMVSGYPARPHREAQEVNAIVQRLPVYVEKIKELQRKIEELEKNLKKT